MSDPKLLIKRGWRCVSRKKQGCMTIVLWRKDNLILHQGDAANLERMYRTTQPQPAGEKETA